MPLLGNYSNLNSETETYKALRLEANDPAGSYELAIFDQFVTQGKKDGWWEKIVEFYPWMGVSVAGVSVKGKYFTTSSLTITGFSDSDFADISKGFGTFAKNNTSKYAVAGCNLVSAGLSQTNLFVLSNFLSDLITPGTGSSGSFALGIEHATTASNECVFGLKTTACGFGNEFSGSMGPGIRMLNYNASAKTYRKDHSLCNSATAPTGYPTTNWGGDVKFFRQTRSGATGYVYGYIGITVIASSLTDVQISSIYYASKRFDEALGRVKTQMPLVCFGDSITSAHLASTPTKSFSTLLSKKLGLPDKNMGVGGSRLTADSNSPTYYAGMSRLTDIFEYNPAMFVVIYGTNDIAGSVATATFQTNLTNLMTYLADYYDGRGITPKAITLCSIPYRTPAGFYTLAKQQEYLESARVVAVSKGVNFADLWGMFYSQFMTGTTPLADGTHPTDAGYALIYKAIMEANGERNFIGVARGIDLNVTNTDRTIHIFGSKYRISKIVLSAPSADITATSATAEIRDAAAGAGNVISTVAWTGLSASTKANEQTVSAHDILTGPLYFRVGTGHGVAACVNVFIYGEVLE